MGSLAFNTAVMARVAVSQDTDVSETCSYQNRTIFAGHRDQCAIGAKVMAANGATPPTSSFLIRRNPACRRCRPATVVNLAAWAFIVSAANLPAGCRVQAARSGRPVVLSQPYRAHMDCHCSANHPSLRVGCSRCLHRSTPEGTRGQHVPPELGCKPSRPVPLRRYRRRQKGESRYSLFR